MPDYRHVKKPAALISKKPSAEHMAVVEAGGNEAAIGTDRTDETEGSQMDIWYRDDRTLVAAMRDGKRLNTFSFTGSISPEDCRAWYLAHLPEPKK